MYFKKLILLTIIFLLASNAYALKDCPSEPVFVWHNCFGTYTNADGNQYVGEWRDNERTGQGTLNWASGNKYIGEFQNNKIHGQGTYTWVGGNKYVGELQDDKLHGQGTYTWPDGIKYVGEFRNNKLQGQGTINWVSGNQYVGAWQNDVQDGQGICTSPEGSYNCEWIEGELQPYDDKIQNAEQMLLYAHPDYQQIINSDEFHYWAKNQPQYIQEWVYENPDNAQQAIRAIDLYKYYVTTNITTAPKNKSSRARSDEVLSQSHTAKPKNSTGSKIFKKIGGFLAEAFIEGISKGIQVAIINEFNEPCTPSVRVKNSAYTAGTGGNKMILRKTRVKVKTCPSNYYFLD